MASSEFDREQRVTDVFGGGPFGVFRFSRKPIVRDSRGTAGMGREQRVTDVFGGGPFGVFRFSRKEWQRETI